MPNWREYMFLYSTWECFYNTAKPISRKRKNTNISNLCRAMYASWPLVHVCKDAVMCKQNITVVILILQLHMYLKLFWLFKLHRPVGREVCNNIPHIGDLLSSQNDPGLTLVLTASIGYTTKYYVTWAQSNAISLALVFAALENRYNLQFRR